MNPPLASKVLLGTASWGADYGVANSSRLQLGAIPNLIRVSLNKGFSGFDTAQDYEVRPEVFANARSAEVFSKLSHELGFESPERILGSILSDLRAMGRHCFDGLAVHSVSQFLRSPKEATKVLEDLKELGLIKSWGVSLYTLEECREVFRSASPDYIQAPVSAVDARFTQPSTLEMLDKRGAVLHGRSIYLQGALLMSPETLPSVLRPLAPTLVNIRELANRHQMSVAHYLLNCTIHLEGVERLVIGVNSASHIEDTFNFLSADDVVVSRLPERFIFKSDNSVLDPRGWKA